MQVRDLLMPVDGIPVSRDTALAGLATTRY